MKTAEEIRARIDMQAADKSDYFGFRRTALLELLPFELAKPFLREGVTEEEWGFVDVETRMRQYIDFAVEKALNQRGISASRSIERYEEWLWVLENDELSQRFHGASYAPYGAPQLKVICEHFGLDDLAAMCDKVELD